MKKLLVLAVLLSGNLLAGERVILKDQKTIDQAVNIETVRCSELGYGLKELKINIEELDGWTIFDHTNINFGDSNIPCMTAGRCKGTVLRVGHSIDDVIQSNPRVETITVYRELVESRHIVQRAENNKVCNRVLIEKLETTVGGVKFNHIRHGANEDLVESACHF